MRIAVILDESYPNGMASANRAHLYSRGLTELGNDVIIFVPRATEHFPLIRNTMKEGVNDGVKFRYACDPVIKKSFMGRRIQNLLSTIATFHFLFLFKPEIIVIAANNFKYILQGKIGALLVSGKLVREKSEVPFYNLQKLNSLRRTRIKIEFSLFDGMIAISESLKDFFLKDLKLKLKIIEVPIIIDTSLPGKKNNGTMVPGQNLVYTGSMLEQKDGVSTIIMAFAKIRKDHPRSKLIMTGEIRIPEHQRSIASLIEKLDLRESVDLTGYVAKEKLEELKSTAFALLLAKPENRQNRYNMATKVGEYLLSGRPAVISSVDPSCRYLKHRENVCITDPDEENLAAEIDFLFRNRDKADSIGSAGRESAITLFDYKLHTARINSFFKVISGTRL